MQPNLSINDLRNMEVPCPSIDDQKSVIDSLNHLASETQKLISLYQRKLSELSEFKKSLLQKAFSGELTKAPKTLIT
jgi:type I restriction enzyme S subunit